MYKKNNIISIEKIQKEISNINKAIDACKVDINFNKYIKDLVNSLKISYRYIFLGRDVFFPLALKGALKLKEITYLSVEGYPSGEIKHGPTDIADENLCTISFNTY